MSAISRSPVQYPAGAVKQPPAFCTGSAMIRATSSAPAATTASSTSASRRAQNAASSSPSGARNGLVLETVVTSIGGVPKPSLNGWTPVKDSAPRVTPW